MLSMDQINQFIRIRNAEFEPVYKFLSFCSRFATSRRCRICSTPLIEDRHQYLTVFDTDRFPGESIHMQYLYAGPS